MEPTLTDLAMLIIEANDEEEMKSLALQIREKGAAIAANLRAMTVMEEGIALEAQRLSNKAAAIRARREKFEEYVRSNMEQMGLDWLDVGSYTFSRAKNPPKVVIDNEEAIPVRFVLTKQTTQLDKSAIKSALKAGEKVEGAHMEQGERLVLK